MLSAADATTVLTIALTVVKFLEPQNVSFGNEKSFIRPHSPVWNNTDPTCVFNYNSHLNQRKHEQFLAVYPIQHSGTKIDTWVTEVTSHVSTEIPNWIAGEGVASTTSSWGTAV